MKKECCTCMYYKTYYLRLHTYFVLSGCGSCNMQKNQTVKHHGSCEKYKTKYYQRKIKHDELFHELDDALTKLYGIKSVLEEHEEF